MGGGDEVCAGVRELLRELAPLGGAVVLLPVFGVCVWCRPSARNGGGGCGGSNKVRLSKGK